MRAVTGSMPLAQLRLRGRVPRIAFVATCSLLSVSGLRSLAAKPPEATPARVAQQADLTNIRGLATQYAIDYLTFVPRGDERRVMRLGALGAAEDTVSQDRVGSAASGVEFAAPVATDPAGTGADVTVAVRRDGAWIYMRIPVRREDGRLLIAASPAIVGAPPAARGQLTAAEDEVEDKTLATVASRVVRHYLQGDRADLGADLDRGAHVDVPAPWLRVAHVDRTTWARPRTRVAVGVTARGPNGLRLSLRYELSVVRRSGRWLVTAIGTTTPIQKEPHR